MSAAPKMRLKSRGRRPRLDGDSAVSLVVQKQSGVNTVKVVEDVKARLDLLKAALPADITTEVIRDQSRFIKKSIEEVKFHLLLGRRAGVGHDPPLHPRLADHLDRHPGDSDVNYPNLYVHAVYGLHAQQHHDARPDPGDRHRDRRRGGRS